MVIVSEKFRSENGRYSVIGPVIGVEAAAAAHGLARQRRGQVLEQERHPAERAVGQAAFDPFPGTPLEAVHDGIQRRIHGLGTRHRRIEQFARRHLARCDQGCKRSCIVPGIVREVHETRP